MKNDIFTPIYLDFLLPIISQIIYFIFLNALQEFTFPERSSFRALSVMRSLFHQQDGRRK